MSADLYLCLFGVFQAKTNHTSITFTRRKSEALLAYLVLHPGIHSREKIAGIFWGDSSDEDARRSLRVTLTDMRKTLGEDVIQTAQDTLALNPAAIAECDVYRFDELLRKPESASEAELLSALELYRGDLLENLYDEWLLPLRETYHTARVAASLQLIERYRAEADYPRAIQQAQKLLSIDPLNEKVIQHLLFCLSASGEREQAIQQFASLQKQAGLEFSAETLALYESIKKQGNPGAVAAHLTNLPHPLTSFIGREAELEAVESLLAPLGRSEQPARLVTLTGAGGSGKTRLSIQAAAELVDTYDDGVWWVELAALARAEDVTGQVARVFGVRETSYQPLEQSLIEVLRRRHFLLVLDNCEHLVEPCARLAKTILESCPKSQVFATSREGLGVPGERIYPVPTLQLPHGVESSPEELLRFEGVRLFVERARDISPSFKLDSSNATAVLSICRRLDGIPLAIELAAARVKMLKVEQIAARLDDRFRLLTGGSRAALPRQQTLRALIDWSYDLLAEPERVLLRRLSVFAGGWTLELAEQVCADPPIDPYQVLDTLSKLVDKSLVITTAGKTGMRYQMLETVREYAREQLFTSGEGEKIRDRHLQVLIDLAERAEPEIRAANQLFWLDRLDEEVDNLRAALAWAEQGGQGEVFLRLASALWRFWMMRGYWADVEWLHKALVVTTGMQTVLRARALGRVAWASDWLEYLRLLKIWASEGERLSRALDDKPGLALALMAQANLETVDQARRLDLLDQAMSLARQIGDDWLATAILQRRAHSLLNHNDLTSARSLLEQSLREAHECGDKRLIGNALRDLGWVTFAQHNAVQAEGYFRETLAIAWEIGDETLALEQHSNIIVVKIYLEDYAKAQEMIAEGFRLSQTDKIFMHTLLVHATYVHLALGDLPGAHQHIEQGLLLAKGTKETGSQTMLADWAYFTGELLRRQGDFVQAGIKYAQGFALYQEENRLIATCVLCESAGMLAIDQGLSIRGVRLLATLETLSVSIRFSSPTFIVREREARLAIARQQLGEEAFNRAWAEGKAMSIEDAICYARELSEG